jgi:hypothetical protein
LTNRLRPLSLYAELSIIPFFVSHIALFCLAHNVSGVWHKLNYAEILIFPFAFSTYGQLNLSDTSKHHLLTCCLRIIKNKHINTFVCEALKIADLSHVSTHDSCFLGLTPASIVAALDRFWSFGSVMHNQSLSLGSVQRSLPYLQIIKDHIIQ